MKTTIALVLGLWGFALHAEEQVTYQHTELKNGKPHVKYACTLQDVGTGLLFHSKLPVVRGKDVSPIAGSIAVEVCKKLEAYNWDYKTALKKHPYLKHRKVTLDISVTCFDHYDYKQENKKREIKKSKLSFSFSDCQQAVNPDQPDSKYYPIISTKTLYERASDACGGMGAALVWTAEKQKIYNGPIGLLKVNLGYINGYDDDISVGDKPALPAVENPKRIMFTNYEHAPVSYTEPEVPLGTLPEVLY